MPVTSLEIAINFDLHKKTEANYEEIRIIRGGNGILQSKLSRKSPQILRDLITSSQTTTPNNKGTKGSNMREIQIIKKQRKRETNRAVTAALTAMLKVTMAHRHPHHQQQSHLQHRVGELDQSGSNGGTHNNAESDYINKRRRLPPRRQPHHRAGRSPVTSSRRVGPTPPMARSTDEEPVGINKSKRLPPRRLVTTSSSSSTIACDILDLLSCFFMVVV